MTTYDARCTREIKSRIALAKNGVRQEKLGFNLRKGLRICYIWSIVLYGTENMGTSECRSEITGKF
jgi:hypothetical protein